MGYMSYTVREYIPPPLRCFKCQRFSHVASQCRGKLRCAKCGGEHEYNKCEQDAIIKCCNCGGSHSAAYGGCEKHKEAREAQKYKIFHKVSYAEAVKKIETEKRGRPPNSDVFLAEQTVWRPSSNKLTGSNDRVSSYNETVQHISTSRPESHQAECCVLKKKLSEDLMLVKKNDFLAFICAVISKVTDLPQGSDKVKLIVDMANDFLGFSSQTSKIQEMINKYVGQNSN